MGTLTALPVRPPSRVDRPVAATAMLLAPLVGVVLGAAAAVVAAVVLLADGAPLLAAALAVSALALLTRGLHLDGLADTADGLASGYDRERALEVMRRGDSGPAGAATLVLVLLVQVAAAADVLGDPLGGAPPIVVAVAASRAVLPLVCTRGWPRARPGGLGAVVVGVVPRVAAAAGVLAVAAAAWATAGTAAALAVAAAAAAALLIARRCTQRLGGLTGDVLGACVEVALAAALVALALSS